MKKIILLKGLPGSGKSTWAKELLAKHPGQYKRINKDDLRSMLDNGKWSRANEKFVLKLRDHIVLEALNDGLSVIVDDTNLHLKHELKMKDIAEAYTEVVGKPCQVEVQDFTNVSVEECIKRDLKRANPVGKDVIMQMYNQFLKPEPKVVKDNEILPTCVICDLDGTLALFGDANPYERDFTQDVCNMRIYELLNRCSDTRTILLVSGRKDIYRDQTVEWLKRHAIPYDYLFMRKTAPEGQQEPKDVVVKREIYEKEIKGKYNVLFVLDDRDQVVEMWREEGLTCLQVAPGDF